MNAQTDFAEAQVSRVTREPLSVAYLETRDNVADIQATWPRLEDLVGSLRGKQFYGSFDPVAGVYRACVVVKNSNDLLAEAQQALTPGVLPGGDYLRLRLRGDPPEVYEMLGPAFDYLTCIAVPDQSRPSLEHYRRHDQIDALLPVPSAAT